MVRAAIVFAAAPLSPTPRLQARLRQVPAPMVIAADDGATTALAFGLKPDLVIGDLDSLEPATLSRLSGVRIERFPRDKDATDGQLAIQRALEQQPTELHLVGFLGPPRLDQELANVLLLATLPVPATLHDERNECVLLRGPMHHAWSPEPTEVVSLIPLSESVSGIISEGLRWRLSGDSLQRGDTRGVSNEPTGPQARVEVRDGLLLLTRYFATV